MNLAQLTPRQLADAEWHLCKHDPFYWMRHHGVIKNEVTGAVIRGIELWEGQDEWADLILSGDSCIALKARRLGLSWIATNLDCHQMMFYDGQRFGVIAQNDFYAQMHLERLTIVHELQPAHLKRKEIVIGHDNDHQFGLAWPGKPETESLCEVHVCSSGSARGAGVRRMRCEEMAHWQNAGDTLTALSGLMGEGCQVVIVSTAKGEGNAYYDYWHGAENGTKPFRTYFIPWFNHPDHDQEWYDRNASAAPSLAEFRQENPATPEEAFILSGEPFFNVERLKLQERAHGMKPIEVRGPLRIYEHPIPGESYAIGADVADGGGDACSADVYDSSGKQVAHWHDFSIGHDTYAYHLSDLGHDYNKALLVVERNNMGHGTCSLLKHKLNYPNLFTDSDGKPGHVTDVKTRHDGLVDHSAKINSGETVLRDQDSYTEHRIFGWYKAKYQAPEGKHDDRVTSARLATFGVTQLSKRRGPVKVYGGIEL